jgi:hypothetical protein
MYIIIEKSTQKSAVIKEKSKVSTFIGKSRSTILRNDILLSLETDKFIIYNPTFIQIKSNRGGKR